MFNELHFQIDNFMNYCDSKGLRRKTKASYEQALRLFTMYLKDTYSIDTPNEIKTAHIRAYISYLRQRGKYTVVAVAETKNINFPDSRTDRNKPISESTIANYMRNIKVFFNFLIEEGEIKENPMKKVPTIKPQRKQKKLMTPKEIKDLMQAFDITTFHGYRNWLITRVMLDTGIRIGECLNLIPENIDFKERSILIVNPKNRRDRYAFFSAKLALDLKRWLEYRDRFSDSEYLFPTTRGTQLDSNVFEKSLKGAGTKAGITSIQSHQLRNNFAKYYLLNGGDFVTLSRILGHSSPDVTMKAYLDFQNNEVAKKYQKHSPFNHFDF